MIRESTDTQATFIEAAWQINHSGGRVKRFYLKNIKPLKKRDQQCPALTDSAPGCRAYPSN